MGGGERKSKLTHECVATEVEGGTGLVAGMGWWGVGRAGVCMCLNIVPVEQ